MRKLPITRKTRGFERLEERRLLAVDLQVSVDDFVLEAPGDQVTRVVRVYNNGNEDAVGAIVQSAVTSQLEDSTWTRKSGYARFVQTPAEPSNAPKPDYVIRAAADTSIAYFTPVGDFNGDGVGDTFVWTRNQKFVEQSFIVFSGHPRVTIHADGRLVPNPPSDAPVGLTFSCCFATPLGDVNGDGFADVASGGSVVFGRVVTAGQDVIDVANLGDREGFALPEYAAPSRAGDINGDGIDDLIITFFEDSNRQSLVVFGAPDIGSRDILALTTVADLDPAVAFRLPFQTDGATSVGDLNGDGHVDFAFNSGYSARHFVAVLLAGPNVALRSASDGAWFYVPRLFGSYSGSSPRARAAGDLDGDGIDDLIVNVDGESCFEGCYDLATRHIEGGAFVVLGRRDLGDFELTDIAREGVFTFETTSLYQAPRPDMFTEDRDGDGKRDLVLTAGTRDIVLFAGTPLRSYDFGGANVLELAEFNGEAGYVHSNHSYLCPSCDALRSVQLRRVDLEGDGLLDLFQFDAERSIVSITLRRNLTYPTHSATLTSGAGDIQEVVDVPAGESRIYTITGKLKPNAATYLESSVAASSGGLERDLRDNIASQRKGVYLDVQVTGEAAPGERATLEITVRNHGSAMAESVLVQETISAGLQDVTWTRESQEFPRQIVLADWHRELIPRAYNSSPPPNQCGSPLVSGTSVGDFNGDGFEDVVLFDQPRMFLGHEAMEEAETIAGAAGAVDLFSQSQYRLADIVALGDMNGDGRDDFFANRVSTVQGAGGVFRERKVPHIILGQTEFPSQQLIPRRPYTDFDADIDGDLRVGFSDFLVLAANYGKSASGRQIDGDIDASGRVTVTDFTYLVQQFGKDFSQGPSGDATIIALKVDPTGRDFTLRPAGDVNGDGLADLIAGTDILLGDPQISLQQIWNLSAKTSLPMVRLYAESGQAIAAVTPLGDINGDGADDLGVRVQNATSYILLGGQFRPGPMSVEASPHVKFTGDHRFSAGGGHDLNNDGLNDVIVATRSGESVSVLFGARELAKEVTSADFDGIRGFEITVPTDNESNVATGDVNGDGFDDLLIGFERRATLRTEGIVYFGWAAMGSHSRFSVDELLSDDQEKTLHIIGSGPRDVLEDTKPLSLSSGWDANRDGIEDLLVVDPVAGKSTCSWNLGEAALIFGRRSFTASGIGPLQGTIDLSFDGHATFHIKGVVLENANGLFGTVTVTTGPNQLQLNPFATHGVYE